MPTAAPKPVESKTPSVIFTPRSTASPVSTFDPKKPSAPVLKNGGVTPSPTVSPLAKTLEQIKAEKSAKLKEAQNGAVGKTGADLAEAKKKIAFYENQQKQLETRGVASGVGARMASGADYLDYQSGAQPAPVVIQQQPQQSNPVASFFGGLISLILISALLGGGYLTVAYFVAGLPAPKGFPRKKEGGDNNQD